MIEQSQARRGRRTGVSIVVLGVSFAVMVMAWFAVAGLGDGVVRELGQLSASIRVYQRSPGLLLGVGFLLCASTVAGSYLILSRSAPAFMAVWLASFALGDAQVGIIQYVALLLRYSMILVLVVLGVGVVTQQIGQRRLEVLQALMLAYVVLQLLHFVIDGPSLEAMLIIPMQVAIGVGVIIGCRDLLSSERSLFRLGHALAWVGMLLTIVALSALFFRESVFLGGRFRGWHDLPTGFATGYVMFLVPLVWVTLGGRVSRIARSCSAVTVVVGTGLVVMSGTRNSILCLLVAVFIMLFFWRRRYILPFIGIALVVTLIAELGDFVVSVLGEGGERVVEFSSGEAFRSQEARLSLWARAWELIGEKSMWGYGLIPNLELFDSRLSAVRQFNAHNAYLGTWIRLGLIGFLLVVATYVVAVVRGMSAIAAFVKERTDPAIPVLFVSLLSTVILGGLFEDNLAGRGSVQQAMLAIVLVALTVIPSLHPERPRHFSHY